MLVPRKNQIRVDLVRKYQNMVAAAQIIESGQLLHGPHTAHRVMGAAKDEELNPLLEFLLHVLKIHFIPSMFKLQG